jgi:hypothetical protein
MHCPGEIPFRGWGRAFMVQKPGLIYSVTFRLDAVVRHFSAEMLT